MELITFSTLFPNAVQPRFGLFVESRLRELRARHDVEATVVAPVPWFPFRHSVFGQYAVFAKVPRRETRDGIEVMHPRYALPPKIGMHIAPRALALGAAGVVKRCAQAFGAPVLDAHYFYPDGVAAAQLAARFDLPLVITARGSDVNLLPQFPAVRRRMLWAAGQASALVAVSQALAERMVQLGMDESKIHVLRNGVDLEVFELRDRRAEREALGLEGPLLLSVGNLFRLKGHDLVIDALKDLPQASLVIAGSGPELGALRERAEAQGVGKRVHFVGSVPQSELVRYYNAADMLVLASSREGMANVLLEALACGTPAVVTPVGGNPEVISSPAAGIVLPDRSAEAIARGVEALLRAPPSRMQTRRYAESFAWSDVVRDLHRLFDDVRRNKGTRRESSQ